VVDIFEVFKTKHISKNQLSEIPIEQLRRKYTRLLSLDSKDQLVDCNALAIVSDPNHIVVDKAKFQEMIAKKVKQQVDIELTKRTDRNQEAIDELKSAAAQLFSDTRSKLSVSIKKEIHTQHASTCLKVNDLFGEESDVKNLKEKILKLLEEERIIIDQIFENPMLDPEDTSNTNSKNKKQH